MSSFQTNESNQTNPMVKNDNNPSDETKSISHIMENKNLNDSPESNIKDTEISSSNNKTFSFTDSSIKSKKNAIGKTKMSTNLQIIKNKDESNFNDMNQFKNDYTHNEIRSKNFEDIQKENSYNTNSTDSEIEANFSVSDKKSKNNQEFELKLYSAASSSSFTRIKRVKSEVEHIKNFIIQETKRLDDEELKFSINERLCSEISLFAHAPKCSVRKKLFKMGLL